MTGFDAVRRALLLLVTMVAGEKSLIHAGMSNWRAMAVAGVALFIDCASNLEVFGLKYMTSANATRYSCPNTSSIKRNERVP